MPKPDCEGKGVSVSMAWLICNINAVVYIEILKRHTTIKATFFPPEIRDYFSRKTSDLILHDLQQHGFIESACA